MARTKGEYAWTPHRKIFVPDVEITEVDPHHVYVPLRGYSASLAVFDPTIAGWPSPEHKCIGWINTETLGYDNVKAFMVGEHWVDEGY